MTKRTSFITQACNVSIAVTIRCPFSASSLIKLMPAIPSKVAKITTLIMDVGCAPVNSAKGLVGRKDNTKSGTLKSVTLPK